MRRTPRARATLTAALLAIGLAVAFAVVPESKAVAWPGWMIRRTDYTSGMIWVRTPATGDTVMFHLSVPDVAEGESIEVLSVRLSRSSPGIVLVGARIYERKHFGGSALLAWQTIDGDDPHRRPSTDLVGATLAGASSPERFVMVEFRVCAPGRLDVEQLTVTYAHGDSVYRQTFDVSFEVRDARPGPPCG